MKLKKHETVGAGQGLTPGSGAGPRFPACSRDPVPPPDAKEGASLGTAAPAPRAEGGLTQTPPHRGTGPRANRGVSCTTSRLREGRNRPPRGEFQKMTRAAGLPRESPLRGSVFPCRAFSARCLLVTGRLLGNSTSEARTTFGRTLRKPPGKLTFKNFKTSPRPAPLLLLWGDGRGVCVWAAALPRRPRRAARTVWTSLSF